MSNQNPEIVICSYDDWEIVKTENGLMLRELDDPETIDVTVTEVYRFQKGEYENKNIPDLTKIVHDNGFKFDYCGELDDFSAYVFWKIV